jgi:hypothetical protein
MAAQSIPAGPDGHDLRAITMNVFGENVVRADAQNRNNGKYVMLAGRAHNTTHARHNPPNVGFQKGLPGFSQLLEIPAVHVDRLSGRLRLDKEKRRNRN